MDTLVTYLLWAAPLVLVPDVLHSRGNFPPSKGRDSQVAQQLHLQRGKRTHWKKMKLRWAYLTGVSVSRQLAEAFWVPFNINPITNNRERYVVLNR